MAAITDLPIELVNAILTQLINMYDHPETDDNVKRKRLRPVCENPRQLTLDTRSPALTARLAALCCLSKKLLTVFQSALYEVVHLTNFVQAQSFCQTVTDKPNLARHVCKLVCDGLAAVKSEDLFMTGPLDPPEKVVEKQLTRFVREAPCLHSVQLAGVDLELNMAQALAARKDQLRHVAIVECDPDVDYRGEPIKSLLELNPSVLCVGGESSGERGTFCTASKSRLEEHLRLAGDRPHLYISFSGKRHMLPLEEYKDPRSDTLRAYGALFKLLPRLHLSGLCMDFEFDYFDSEDKTWGRDYIPSEELQERIVKGITAQGARLRTFAMVVDDAPSELDPFPSSVLELLPAVEDLELGFWDSSIDPGRLWPELPQAIKVLRFELPAFCARSGRFDNHSPGAIGRPSDDDRSSGLIDRLRGNDSHPRLERLHIRMPVHVAALGPDQASKTIQLLDDVEEACAAREPAPVSFDDGGTRVTLSKVRDFRAAFG